MGEIPWPRSDRFQVWSTIAVFLRYLWCQTHRPPPLCTNGSLKNQKLAVSTSTPPHSRWIKVSDPQLSSVWGVLYFPWQSRALLWRRQIRTPTFATPGVVSWTCWYSFSTLSQSFQSPPMMGWPGNDNYPVQQMSWHWNHLTIKRLPLKRLVVLT